MRRKSGLDQQKLKWMRLASAYSKRQQTPQEAKTVSTVTMPWKNKARKNGDREVSPPWPVSNPAA